MLVVNRQVPVLVCVPAALLDEAVFRPRRRPVLAPVVPRVEDTAALGDQGLGVLLPRSFSFVAMAFSQLWADLREALTLDPASPWSHHVSG
jgi:hypothetical protein